MSASKLLSKLRLLLDRVIFILACASSLACLFCMFFISVVVGSRYLLNYSISGLLDITELMLVSIVFLPVAYVEKLGGHLQITLLFSSYSKRIQSMLNFLIWKIVSFILFGFLTWVAFEGMLISYAEKETSWGDLALPLWIPKLFIFLGCLIMCLYELINYLIGPRDYIGGKK